jgi:hypothetical protein
VLTPGPLHPPRPRHVQDLSAHVLYRLTRCRLAANLLAFSASAEDNRRHRQDLIAELALMRQEYATLLYGGRMILQVG